MGVESQLAPNARRLRVAFTVRNEAFTLQLPTIWPPQAVTSEQVAAPEPPLPGAPPLPPGVPPPPVIPPLPEVPPEPGVLFPSLVQAAETNPNMRDVKQTADWTFIEISCEETGPGWTRA